MTLHETAFIFSGNGQNNLIGIIHEPTETKSSVGLLIIVGGPQYRIGAHRQYVHLARHCADRGIAAMRFDYQGVGDSDGVYPGFEHVTADVHAAVNEFLRRCPTIESVAIWGLCEGASAILLGAAHHKAVSHVILANPWVRSESGRARAYVKHYYLDRLRRPEFWKKIFSGKLNIAQAIGGFLSNIKKTFTGKSVQKAGSGAPGEDVRPFPERMLAGLTAYPGQVLLIQSEQDLVAREFDDLVASDKAWRQAIRDKISRRIDIAESDHTFSSEKWRRQVADATARWLLSGE